MKHKLQKQAAALVLMAVLCTSLLGSAASAATLVVIDLADIVEETAPSVVEVFTESKQVSSWFREYVTQGAGSGVILSADGYIVTNHHVVAGANTIKVRLSSGQTYTAALAGTDEKTDLAVLKIDASGLTAAKLTDSSAVRVGDFVIAIGNPLGELGGTVTNGIISAKDREVTIDGQTMTLLQTSAAVNPGNSGGGLFDLNGALVGVVNAKSSGSGIEGLAFAIPANTVNHIAQELILHGYVTGRPQLGISVVQVTRPGMGWQTHSSAPGLYVAQTSADNGLQTGDRLIQIDGAAVSSTADISAILDRHSVGDTVPVVISRGNSEITVMVKLTEQKPAQAFST